MMEAVCLRILVFGMLLSLTYGKALQESCVTPECKEAAHKIRNNLNQSVDPCEDFYEFSCGGWISKQIGSEASQFRDVLDFTIDKILEIAKEPINSNSSRSLQQAKIYFKSCLYVYSYEEYAKIGGYPLLQSEWNPTNFTNTLKWISERFSLANKSVQTEKKRPLKYWAVSISEPPSLSIQTYMKPSENKKVIQTYKDKIYNSTKSLCSYFQLGFNETGVKKDIEDIFEFETLYTKLKASENEAIYDDFSYMNINIAKMNLNSTGMDILLNHTSMRTLSNYFMWINFVKPALDMDKLTEPVIITQLELNCVLDTTKKIQFILEADFIRREFDHSKIPDVLERYNNIYNTIEESIMGYKWILPEVKEEALDLMENLDLTLGYPNWVTHSSLTDYFYKDLENLTATDGMQNILKINIMFLQKMSSNTQIRELLDIIYWKSLINPNAFYYPNLNGIAVVLPLMLKPYLQKTTPEYLSYGGIGFIIGHELFHAFQEGFGLSSNYSDAITNENVNCIKEQFAEYSSKANHSIQKGGLDSLMENMADTGSLQVVFEAYKSSLYYEAEMNTFLPDLEHYSPEQLFFIRFAQSFCAMSSRFKPKIIEDPHSLEKYRVIGSVSNSKEFAQVFECAPESPMNRGEKRCDFLG